MDIIPATSSKISIKDINLANYLLIIDAYYKTQKLYGMDNTTTEEVVDMLDMFQARF